MEKQEFDVLVIGAGAAGLMGSWEIALAGKKVALIEAQDKAGGRIRTVMDNGHPVDLGAEFVHGNLPLTRELLKMAGVETYTAGGSIWQFKKGELQEQADFIEDVETLESKFSGLKSDKTVAAFLHEDLAGERHRKLRFSLQNYVEGYYAADTQKASTEALRAELSRDDDEQYCIDGSYQQLVALLEKKCRNAGVEFFCPSLCISSNGKKAP